ncbi:7-deoxyloganetic acid glucosyltransferase isoform X1 [Vitis vinifera]|uniref:7-deoxyloganetic acid glucosyltransferase isoform X1 n=1 Tax=Vitis vinifera TaxID=29760 RepID=UPI00019847F5|nr:7-deoxyloganetic acid glucosyltransferase isoform X1 [Vitis vinifera]|eukprot:XP_019079486.1 PREDICTED: 7-deoxyloganetic acid glucosyltransferase isoform X1 [Vitis vinifera]
MEHRSVSPHVLVFPFPIQGHVNSMLKLAELLSLAGLRITFLNSDYTHSRLLRYTNILDRFTRYAGFRFQTISDGLPLDHPRTGVQLKDMFDGMKATTKPLFREMIMSWCRSSDPVTCIIADGIMGFAIDVGNEVGVPTISFRTSSPCAFWAYFSLPQLIEAGEVPFKGLCMNTVDDDMDQLVTSVPGMEGFLRRRDLPSFCRTKDANDPNLQLVMIETRQTPRADALILNTFEDLDGATLSQIRSHCPKLYTIGPLHAHLKSRLASETTASQFSNSLWEEDKRCIPWLDRQPSKSVIYVSFGSLTVITKEELMEFWHGLVNSGSRFLWVIRPDSLTEKDGEFQPPAQLWEVTKERGQIVGWVPQEEVLAHPAVGGFLTYSGWNSTIESIFAGVPMICWPYFADQQVNSRFVSHVWKLGMDMKDTCDRVTIEKMVRDLMEKRRTEFTKSAEAMAKLARSSLSEGGSSYCNFSRLIESIRLMSA